MSESSQPQLELEFVTNGNATEPDRRNRWLQRPRDVHPTVYDPHEIHPPTLIEVDSTNVVVRRHQPESRSVGPAGITSKPIHQRTTDAFAFDQRLNRDDLDAVCSLRKGRQSCPLTVVLGDEARKLSSIDHLSQTSNLR